MRVALTLLLLLLSPLARAADISGKADIVDGGTIEIAGQRIRLHGIHAPEYARTCPGGAAPWHCGQEAAFALADAIGRTWVECDVRDAGTLRRVVAVCRVGGPKGRDLGAWMVAQGWARAGGDADYAALEAAARDAGKGLWRAAPPLGRD